MNFLARHLGGCDECRQCGKPQLINGVQEVRATAALIYESELDVACATIDIDAFQTPRNFRQARGPWLLCQFLVFHESVPLLHVIYW
jgi:hypothetical protein